MLWIIVLLLVSNPTFGSHDSKIYFENSNEQKKAENNYRTGRGWRIENTKFGEDKAEPNRWGFGTGYNPNPNQSALKNDSRSQYTEQNYQRQTNNQRRAENGDSTKRSLLPESTCGVDLPRRILGGVTVDIDEFPWLVLLQYRNRNGKISHNCGGALISSRYVVTAAHCTIGLGVTARSLTLQKVRLGEWDLSTEQDCQQDICNGKVQDIEIEEIVNHPNYDARQTSQTNDIALLRLKRNAEINQFVQPICLPLDEVSRMEFEGKRLSVAGWGRTKNVKDSSSNIKMKVEVPVVSLDSCRSFYDSFYNDVKLEKSQMCAGGEEGKDTCQGDSGGPLMTSVKIQHEFRWFLIGIVSSGPAACGVEGRPSIYTKVTDFTDWILQNMRE